MEINMQVLWSIIIFLLNLRLFNTAPAPQNNDVYAPLDAYVLPYQIVVDGIPKDDIPEKFIDIATKIEEFQLRPIFQTDPDPTDTMMERVVKKMLGKTVLVDENETKSLTRVKRDGVELSTLCSDQSCIELLKQYEQWRQEHGYAYYTGVWKVGK